MNNKNKPQVSHYDFGFWCFKMLHLVDDKCETQGNIMAARIRTLDPKTCKNEYFGR